MPLFSSVILQVKDTDINDSLHYLYSGVCVCVWEGGEGGEGEVKSISVLHDAQLGVTESPTYKDLSEVLYLVAGTLEVLNLVFACICNEKD